MQVFVLEWATGGGFSGRPLPASLAREGALMRDRLALDLTRLPGVQASCPLDPRLETPDLPTVLQRVPADPAEVVTAWLRLARAAGACLPIAPEGEPGVVELYRSLLAGGVTLLGSRPEAVALAADKAATILCLGEAGLAVPETLPADRPPAPSPTGWVVKPRHGAGCDATRRVEPGRDPRQGLADPSAWVVEPWIEGQPASLSLLCAEGEAWLLACNRQLVTLEPDGLRYRGGIVGGLEERRGLLEPIARTVARAMPGLWGLVGIDLIDRADGPVVLEVNPRPTTSCVGLGRSLGLNPMALLLDLLRRPLRELVQPLAPRPVEVLVDG
jgi:predicted ATP-grasp superfamily ATP-dependent carboligase